MERREPLVVEEYAPGWRFYAVVVALWAASFSLGLYVSSRYGATDGPAWIWWFTGLFAAAFVLPCAVQYLLLRRFGAHPRLKVKEGWGEGLAFTSWCSTDGYRFTRMQFALAYGVPALIFCVILLAYAIRIPTAAPALSFALPVCLGNLWYALLALGKPEGTRVEKEPGSPVRFTVPLQTQPAR